MFNCPSVTTILPMFAGPLSEGPVDGELSDGQSSGLRHCHNHLSLDPLHGAAPDADQRRHLQYALPGGRWLLMAFSTLGETLGRPSFFPCWRTRSSPARTLARSIDLSCSPNTDAIWIMARPIGVRCRCLAGRSIGRVPPWRWQLQDATPQTVDRPDHQDIKPTADSIVDAWRHETGGVVIAWMMVTGAACSQVAAHPTHVQPARIRPTPARPDIRTTSNGGTPHTMSKTKPLTAIAKSVAS